MVGGSVGDEEKRGKTWFAIGIGLGKIASKARLSSRHDPFMAFFVVTVVRELCAVFLIVN